MVVVPAVESILVPLDVISKVLQTPIISPLPPACKLISSFAAPPVVNTIPAFDEVKFI